MDGVSNKRSYAGFSLGGSWMQVHQALDDRRNAKRNMRSLFQLILRDEARMVSRLGRPVENLRILEIGPGQGLERARYFGARNEVVGFDLDVIPVQNNVRSYYQMFRQNGLGRLVKTLGRKIIVGKANERAWAEAVGTNLNKVPKMYQGDICKCLPELGLFDLVMSWSVFEHLPDPKKALENIIQSLKPGGMFYLSIHIYTANNGHHDIRAFTGHENQLPLWGHLRASTNHLIHPGSYLNKWRLAQWRSLFATLNPGYVEFLEGYEHALQYSPRLTGEIRAELSEYSEEELFTIDAIYSGQIPGGREDI